MSDMFAQLHTESVAEEQLSEAEIREILTAKFMCEFLARLESEANE